MAKPHCELEVERPEVGDPDRARMFEVRCRVDGKLAGRVDVMRTKEAGREVMGVGIIGVGHGYRKQGLGTQIYAEAARVACEDFGLPLASDKNHQRSEAAESFWKKQHRKGRAVCIGDSGGKTCRRWVLSCPAPASLEAAPEVEPVIQAREREIVPLPVEHGALYEQDGRLVWYKKGRSKAVLKLTPEEVAQFPDRIFTHNHPTVYVKGRSPTGEDALRIIGSSLSPVDVVMAAKHNLAEVRAVTRMVVDGQERTIVYRIERPRGGWPSWRSIEDELASFQAGQKVRLSIARRVGSGAYQDKLATSMDEGWKRLAPVLGLKYESMVLDGAASPAPRKRRRRR